MNVSKFDLGQAVINSPINNLRRSVIRWVTLIILAAVIATPLMLAGFLLLVGRDLHEFVTNPNIVNIILGDVIMLVVIGLVFLGLHYDKGSTIPGGIITFGMTIAIIFSDSSFEIKSGRSTIFLALPIVLSSLTVKPYFSLLIAFLYTILLSTGEFANPWAAIAFWVLAFAVWLSTSLLERAIQKSQDETNRIRSMLGIISHELRTPLSSIKGYSDLLLMDRSALNPTQTEMITRAQSAALSLIDLVNNILDATHIQSGKLTIIPKPTKTAHLYETQMDFARRKADERGLTFTYTLENLPPVLLIDEIRLRQIVVNLTDNAIKFTQKGSVNLTIAAKNNSLVITCSDTGIGISEEDLSKIFQEFVQAQNYVTREYSGVGLGLSIVNHLVKKMGGEIKAKSKLDVGTTMVVTMPLHIPEENKVPN